MAHSQHPEISHPAALDENAAAFEEERREVLRLMASLAMALGIVLFVGSLIWTCATCSTFQDYRAQIVDTAGAPDNELPQLAFTICGALLIVAAALLYFKINFGRWMLLIVGVGTIVFQAWAFCALIFVHHLTFRFSAQNSDFTAGNALVLSLAFPILCIVAFVATRAAHRR